MSLLENKKALLGIACGLAIAAGVITWLYQSGSVPQQQQEAGPQVSAVVKNTVLQREQGGAKLWEFHVAEAQRQAAGNAVLLKGIKGQVYRKDGSVLDVKADGGRVLLGKNDFRLQGRVVAVLSSGGVLKADRVDYDQNKELLSAHGHVDITKDEWRATGNEIVTTTEFKHFKMKGKAKVEKGGMQ